MRTLVILPTYNEAENIAEVLRRVRAAVPEASILVVDDGSPDGTAEIVDSLAAEIGDVDVFRRFVKGGLGSTYRAGFRIGMFRGYEALVEMDSDLQHDPAALPALLRALGESDEIGLVIGSRYVPGGSIPSWTLRRRLLSQWGNRYAALVLGMKIRDSTSGYRVYRTEAVAEIHLDAIRADGYGFQIEMAYKIARNGWTVNERPIRFVDRVRGESKMDPYIVVEAMQLVTWWALRDRVLKRRSRR